MKKLKICIVLFIVFTSFSEYSESIGAIVYPRAEILSQPIYEFHNTTNTPWWGIYGLWSNQRFYLFMLDFLKPVEIRTDDIFLDINKYLGFNYKQKKYILIFGGDVIFYDNLPDFGFMFPSYLKEFPPTYSQGSDSRSYVPFWNWEDGIKSITPSSVLIEKTPKGDIAYDVAQLQGTFFGMYDSPIYFNSFKRAWAEGSPGNGIGESLDISFKVNTDHVMVLNGYVNLRNMKLYTENNRVKSLRIVSSSPSFDITYVFEDYVHFAEISFPNKTNHVKLIITEIYKGTKYNDTCITSVFLKQLPGFSVPEPFKLVPQGSSSYNDKISEIKTELQRRGFLY